MTYPERIVPDEETATGVVALHLRRYAFALPHVARATVLDAGCGVGYGSAFLAETAERVVGLDVSGDAIAYAQRRYVLPNVEFAVADLTALELPDGSFDAICMFEVIEHLADREAALAEAVRVLRGDGVLFVSTPQVERTTESPANPYHHVEYARDDFRALLGRFFGEVDLFGQRRLRTRRHRLVQRLDVLGLRRRLPPPRAAKRLLGTAPTMHVGPEDVVIARDGIEDATELVAVCRLPKS